MSIARFSVKQPVMVNMLVILILAGGYIFGRTMVLEVFPEVALGTITITTLYPGASPEEMEDLITIPIEDEIADVDGIDTIQSSSTEGRSFIIIELEAGVRDAYKVRQDIQTEIDKLTDLPADAEDPEVREVTLDFPVLIVSIYGEADENLLRNLAEDFKDEVENVPGVGSAIITGIREREIWVEIDPERLYSYNLTLRDVMDSLRNKNLDLAAGTVKTQQDEILVRTVGKFRAVQEIENVILKSDEVGKNVYVRDIATVRDTFEEERTRARTNRKKAVNLDVRKKALGDAIAIAQKARGLLDDFRPRLPQGITADVTMDSSKYIRNRLHTMIQQGTMGLVLVICVLYTFVGLRPALMAALGIPVSLFGTLILMYFCGITINMLSLFAMIVVLGMIVDDAIVVLENAYRYMEEGVSPADAAVKGTEEVMMPVIATVLTTISAFVPMLLVSGLIGKFLRVIPMVVILALIVSLIEALLVLPSHIAEWTPAGAAVKRKGKLLPGIVDFYSYLLNGALRFRYLTVSAVILLAVGAIVFAATVMPFKMFHSAWIDFFKIYVETPVGSKLDQTDRIVRQVEEQVFGMPSEELDTVTSSVGISIPVQIPDYGTNLAELTVDIPDKGVIRAGTEIVDDARHRLREVKGVTRLTVDPNQAGPPLGKSVSIKVRGDDMDVLLRIAEEIKAYLRSLPGVVDVADDFKLGKSEVRVQVEQEKASRFRLDTSKIAHAVRYAFEGGEATTFREGNDEIDVVVKFREGSRKSVNDISQMKFRTPSGALVPFENFGKLKIERGYGKISRTERKRTILVTADVTGKTTSARANALVQQRFADLGKRYPGYSLSFEGEEKDRRESLQSLFAAFWVALLMIYVILAALFKSFIQPIVVMFTVPFAFIGVVFGFFVAGQPLGLMAVIGVVALAGIVVNDSIVMVDFINRRRTSGMERDLAVRDAGRVRFRPIICTSVTTIFGLLPLAFLARGQAAFLSPLAIAIVWGLIFATVLTLIVIPCTYTILDDIVNGVKRAWRWIRGIDSIPAA